MSRSLILVLCTGNTCRSPMGEHLLRHALKAEPEPLNQLPVVSAGISAMSGDEASLNSQRAMQKAGLSLAEHRSRYLRQELLDETWMVLAMTSAHLDLLEGLYENLPPHRHRFRDFLDDSTASPEVPDPFGGPLDEYIACRDSLVEAIPGIIKHLKTLELPKNR